jgi:hypothetical protein
MVFRAEDDFREGVATHLAPFNAIRCDASRGEKLSSKEIDDATF